MTHDVEAIALAKCYAVLLRLAEKRREEKSPAGQAGQRAGDMVNISADNNSISVLSPSTSDGGGK